MIDNPTILLGIIAVIFGIFNLFLWLIIIKSEPQKPSPQKQENIEALFFSSEKRLTDTITKMFKGLQNQVSTGGIDVKQIIDEISKNIPKTDSANFKEELSKIRETFKNEIKNANTKIVEEIKNTKEELKKLQEELSQQKEFIEAIDAHLAEQEKESAK
ncbi:MAG: hypothetical protein J7L42_02410 [Elusimicrobia bacterium]|nr:hypothetical protein [Elusimicrobiota bacterium]